MNFKIFPKTKLDLTHMYIVLLIFGTFGIHSFILGKWKQGIYLLLTIGGSHLVTFSFLTGVSSVKHLSVDIFYTYILTGFLFGIPILIYDLIKMREYVGQYNRKVEQV
jgi:TM2 domain-containing membrane protein YozV